VTGRDSPRGSPFRRGIVRKSTEAFQRAFHTVYWADFHDYDSAMASTGGERQLWTYLLSFYDQVGVLLRRRLIEFDLADDLLGNSTRQLWEKGCPNDPRGA
jgi:hypothetical protein